MDEIFSNKVHTLTLKFIHLLFTHKREAHLSGVCRNFIEQYKKKSGVQEALIITAQTLTEDNKKKIHDYITDKFKAKIELSEKVDHNILGGFILRIEDQQINASIQSQLKKIKRELINS
jgi:F-type H+-transporting ATPase subunit delta